jgi:hypothetical protein
MLRYEVRPSFSELTNPMGSIPHSKSAESGKAKPPPLVLLNMQFLPWRVTNQHIEASVSTQENLWKQHRHVCRLQWDQHLLCLSTTCQLGNPLWLKLSHQTISTNASEHGGVEEQLRYGRLLVGLLVGPRGLAGLGEGGLRECGDLP